MDIFQSLESLEKAEADKHDEHVDFVLNYFGVRKHSVKGNTVYLLVNKDADWIKSSGNKGVFKDGKRVTIGSKQLVIAIQSHWQSELLSVGIKLLQTLEALYKLKTKGSSFHQSTCLLHIFEVSKFLLDCSYLKLTYHHIKTLEQFLRIFTSYFDIVFPLDWRRSVSEDLISLRETYLSLQLLEDIILQSVDKKSDFSYWTIGRVMMICLGSGKPFSLYEKIITGIQWNPQWKSFFEGYWSSDLKDIYFAPLLQNALEDAYRANWRSSGYISPHSFVYLLDRLLFMNSFSSGIFFTTKSSFLEWFNLLHSTQALLAPKQMFSEHAVGFFIGIIQEILYNKVDTAAWIRNSNVNPASYHPLLVIKLVMILSLICLKVTDCSQVLLDLLLGRNNIAYFLPQKFVSIILRRRRGHFLNLNPDMVAEAFMSINDPLMVVNSGNASQRVHAPCAIFMDLRKSKQEIMSVLFPRISIRIVPISQPSSNNVGVGTVLEKPSSKMLPDANMNVKSLDGCKGELKMNWKVLEEISESLNQKKGESLSLSSDAIKKELDKNIHTLTTVFGDEKFCAGGDTLDKVIQALGELKLLSSAFDKSEHKEKGSVFTSDAMKSLQEVVKSLQFIRPLIDGFLNGYVKTQDSKVMQNVVSESRSTTEVHKDKDHVQETTDEHINVDSTMEKVVEKQSNGGNTNTQDSKTKKGKGNNKGKNKGKKNKNTKK